MQSIKENVVNYERKLGGKKPNDIEKTGKTKEIIPSSSHPLIEASSESLSETIALLPELVRQKDVCDDPLPNWTKLVLLVNCPTCEYC